MGADRYLMRHETADEKLYEKLHPGDKFENRKAHLLELKRMGEVVLPLALTQRLLADSATYWLNIPATSPDKAGAVPFWPWWSIPTTLIAPTMAVITLFTVVIMSNPITRI